MRTLLRRLLTLALVLLPAQSFAANRFLITGGGSVTWSNANTAIWASVSGGATGASVPGSSDSVIMDANSGGGTVTLNYAPTLVSINMAAYTNGTFADGGNIVTLSSATTGFTLSGSVARTLNATASKWTIAGCSPIANTTTTNETVTSWPALLELTCTGALSLSAMISGPTPFNDISAVAAASMSTAPTTQARAVTIAASGAISLGTGGWAASGNVAITGGTCTGAGILTLNGTSGTQTLSAPGCASGMTVNNSGTAVTLNAATTGNYTHTAGSATFTRGETVGIVTLTAGTVNTNSQTIQSTSISSSNSNVRTLSLGSSLWTVTGSGTPLSFATTTNLTLNPGTSKILFTESTAAAKALNCGGATFYDIELGGTGTGTWTTNSGTCNAHDFLVSDSGAATLQINQGIVASRHVNFTGFGGTMAGAGGITFGGNFTLSSAMTGSTWTGGLVAAGTSGTQLLTSAGVTLRSSNLTVNNTGATLQLVDALSLLPTNLVLLTAGTLDLNGQAVTSQRLTNSGSAVRTLTCGTSTWSLAQTTGAAWLVSGTNATVSCASGVIKLTGALTGNVDFTGQGNTYGTYWCATTNAFACRLLDSNTFGTLRADAGRTLSFLTGTTTTATTWTLNGSVGNLVTLGASSTGNYTLVPTAAASITYASLNKATVSPGRLTCGTGCVDAGNNGGVIWANDGTPSTDHGALTRLGL